MNSVVIIAHKCCLLKTNSDTCGAPGEIGEISISSLRSHSSLIDNGEMTKQQKVVILTLQPHCIYPYQAGVLGLLNVFKKLHSNSRLSAYTGDQNRE